MAYTGHVDTFAEEHLPRREALPELCFDLPELRYPQRLNAAAALLERNLSREGARRRCIVAPEVEWSYGDLAAAAGRVAGLLVRDYGLQTGNRVLLRAPNTPMLAACWLGVLLAGGVAVTTMPLYREAELRFMIEKARVRLALCDRRLRAELDSATEDLSGFEIGYFGTADSGDLETRMAALPPQFAAAPTAAEDVAIVAFTSGTTGKPKAAMHYHRDLIATCDTYGARVLRPVRDDLFCGSAPLGFTFGLGGHLLYPLYAGAASLLLERARPDDLLAAIARYGVTTLFTAPIAYRTMSAAAKDFDLSTLRTCVSAGETLPKPVWDGWHAQTGLKILDGIGSTEMLHIFVGSPEPEVRAGSTGRAVPGYVAEVHDDEGRPVATGAVGRLAVKGPTGCKYLDDERQHAYVQDGWNYPGDAYRRDEQGYFWYVARTDDMIVSAGYNISGPEVEEALIAHAEVREAAVVAKRDPAKDTNIVKAYVVLEVAQNASEAKADELREFCKAKIAPFKAPREIEFVERLPRTETGKVQRYKLREV